MKKIGSNPPKQPRLKGLLKIIQADEGQRGDILVGELHRILKRTITPEIEQDLESIAEQGSLLDHIVAYNRIWDVDIHLTYQRNRRKKGKEVMNSADKPDRAYLRSLLNDVKDEGYFWKKVVLPNLEKRERVLGRLTTKGSDIYTWREAVVIQNQLGIKGKKQDFESYSERYVELKDKIHYYTDHTDKFQKDFQRAISNLIRGRKNSELMNFLLELTIGEDVIYHKLREKEKTNPLVNRIKDNLLFQKSGRDFEYPLKLFYGQMHKAIFKIGIDPTTPDLHLGHTVPLQVAKEFQDLGCYITVIIGDLTAAIGDPSGRPDARKTLPYEEIRNNVAEYESQVSKILRRGKTNFIYNSSWLKPLRADCLDQLLFNFKEYDIMQRRDFQKRVSTSLTRGETTYPIYQATDSATIGSAWELGGQDQLINMMLGRRLQQKLDIESQMLLFTPLLVGIYGKEKMSKSLNNCIALNDSPKEIYQKIMNLPDYLVYDYYLLLTSEKEIFKNVPEDKRGDLFAAFGGLNLIQDYGGRIVRENEIRLSGDIETILKRIEEGNGDGLKENKYLQSGDIDLLKDLIFTLDREIKSHEKRKRGELHLKDYKPDYTIIADHRDKEEPLKIIAGKEDDITQAVLYEFMLYEKKTDGSVYDPRNLKERLAKHLVLKYHGREGLEEVYKLQEEILMQETTRRGGKPLKYINLDDYTHGGKLRIPSLFKRGFGMGVEAVAKKAEEGLVTLDGVPVHFKKSLGRKGGTFYTPNFQFGPGSHELIIGSKANPLERVYSVARGPKT